MYASGLLIVGETGSGKTALTWHIASLLAQLLGEDELVIADFAPSSLGVGRPLPPIPGSRLYRPSGIRAPRLESGGMCGEAWRLAKANAELTSDALERVSSDPGRVLVVNDATIHLHAGDPGLLFKAIKSHRIAVVNAYMGSRIADRCGISTRERLWIAMLGEVLGRVWVAGL